MKEEGGKGGGSRRESVELLKRFSRNSEQGEREITAAAGGSERSQRKQQSKVARAQVVA
jgi:hypothetical protein